jgi:tRNA-(ms[2]io[6]A)-hydroxylase
MLSLQSTSSERWLAQVRGHLNELLIDHAHCEKKAAGTAMNLLFAYVENHDLTRAMTEIVQEELTHFHQVLDILKQRGVRFRRLKPSNYGGQLHELIRKNEPGYAIDRLLVAGLIEARSCERFGLLREHLAQDDPQLAAFYDSLFESEARHHSTYVRLAKAYASDDEVHARLDELAAAEARIIATGDQLPRMHS